ncbi:resolvase [Acinetobacter seifertii]|uniref:recombinase family protein n=1 Tax=Acinetobacter seifertii TaxID=1530123 RepID=UPI000C2215F9|nr:resolvase [Acinetobacter seifertii]
MRVSTKSQDLERQEKVISDARNAGYYIAAVYKEKASGISPDRPELNRMINDLQPGEVVIAERIDRISRLPLPEAEKLITAIKEKGAKLSVPGVIDFSEFTKEVSGVSKIVLEAVQEMLLKIALQMAHEDYLLIKKRRDEGIKLRKEKGLYEGRKADEKIHEKIIELRKQNISISKTASIANCSISLVKLVWKRYNESKSNQTDL